MSDIMKSVPKNRTAAQSGRTTKVRSIIERNFSKVDAGIISQLEPLRFSVIPPYNFTGKFSISAMLAVIKATICAGTAFVTQFQLSREENMPDIM